MQCSLFLSDKWRYWAHWTDRSGSAAECDWYMRDHAYIEDTIARVKDVGGDRFPFKGFAANNAWLQLAAFIDTAVRWFQKLCFTGPLARAKYKA